MRDFYAHLNLATDSSDEAIRAALTNAPPDLRAEAQFILLDPRRRAVYDRNHHLLCTIGDLRSHLGLSYTRFWARQEYKEFWKDLSAAAIKPGRRVDATMIAGAFKAVGHHGRKHVTNKRNWMLLLIAAGLYLLALAIWWLAR